MAEQSSPDPEFCTLYSREAKENLKREEYRERYSGHILRMTVLLQNQSKFQSESSATSSHELSPSFTNAIIRESSSGQLSSVPKGVESIKEAVGLELNGSTWGIKENVLDTMLEAATTAELCKDYLQNCSTYQRQLNALRRVTAEKDIYKPATKLIQSILNHFGLGQKRKVIDTHSSRLHHTEVRDDSPPIPEVKDEFPSISGGKTNSKPLSQASDTSYSSVDLYVKGTREEFDFTDPKLHPWIKKDVSTYTTCLTPIEVKLKGCKDTESELFCQAGMYTKASFNSQRHRSFVYILMMNEEEVRLYYFDNCGGRVSNWRSFKDDLSVLIRMVILTCKAERELVGLDPAFSFVPIPNLNNIDAPPAYQRKIHIDIGNGDMVLTVLNVTWSSNAILGRKTTCWRVMDEQDNIFILKECSRLLSRTPAEWTMLKKVQRAANNMHPEGTVGHANKKDTKGLGIMVGYMRTFKVSDLRRSIKLNPLKEKLDRERCFFLLQEYGLPITHFQSPMQLLYAIRDAIAGHRNLWRLGILHRDVSINNILLGKEGAEEGNRGILIDLDLAIFFKRVTSSSIPDSRTGTHAFLSHMLLSNTSKHRFQFPHNHLDDLESFFWVLIWITLDYEIDGKGQHAKPLKVPQMRRSKILQGFEKDASTAAKEKWDLISGATVDLANGWRKEFFDLVNALRLFLRKKVDDKRIQRDDTSLAKLKPDVVSKPDLPNWVNRKRPLLALNKGDEVERDYETFLGLFDKAISQHRKYLNNAAKSLMPTTLKGLPRNASDPAAKQTQGRNPVDNQPGGSASPVARKRKGRSQAAKREK